VHAAWLRASFVACRAASPKRRARPNSSRARCFHSRRACHAASRAARCSCAQPPSKPASTLTFSQPGMTKPRRVTQLQAKIDAPEVGRSSSPTPDC
jgi:hypothetical protein